MPRAVYGGMSAWRGRPRSLGDHAPAVDTTDLDAVAAAIGPTTRLLWLETISNPTTAMADIAALAELAHERGVAGGGRQHVRLARTWPPRSRGRGPRDPLHDEVHRRPLATSSAGRCVGRAALVAAAREIVVNAGGNASPFEAFLALRGLKTLAAAHGASLVERPGRRERARGRARRRERSAIPGLASHPQHELAAAHAARRHGRRDARGRPRGRARRTASASSMRCASAVHATSLGGVETLCSHPASLVAPAARRRRPAAAGPRARHAAGLDRPRGRGTSPRTCSPSCVRRRRRRPEVTVAVHPPAAAGTPGFAVARAPTALLRWAGDVRLAAVLLLVAAGAGTRWPPSSPDGPRVPRLAGRTPCCWAPSRSAASRRWRCARRPRGASGGVPGRSPRAAARASPDLAPRGPAAVARRLPAPRLPRGHDAGRAAAGPSTAYAAAGRASPGCSSHVALVLTVLGAGSALPSATETTFSLLPGRAGAAGRPAPGFTDAVRLDGLDAAFGPDGRPRASTRAVTFLRDGESAGATVLQVNAAGQLRRLPRSPLDLRARRCGCGSPRSPTGRCTTPRAARRRPATAPGRDRSTCRGRRDAGLALADAGCQYARRLVPRADGVPADAALLAPGESARLGDLRVRLDGFTHWVTFLSRRDPGHGRPVRRRDAADRLPGSRFWLPRRRVSVRTTTAACACVRAASDSTPRRPSSSGCAGQCRNHDQPRRCVARGGSRGAPPDRRGRCRPGRGAGRRPHPGRPSAPPVPGRRQLLVVDAASVAVDPTDRLMTAVADAGLAPAAVLLAAVPDGAHLPVSTSAVPILVSAPARPAARRGGERVPRRRGVGHRALCDRLRLAGAEAALADPTPAAPAGLVAARLRRGVAVIADGELVALHARPAGHALAARFSATLRARSLDAGTRRGGTRRTRDGLWLHEANVRPGASVWMFDDLPFAAVDLAVQRP